MDRQDVERWLRSHGSNERSFQRALRDYFRGQAKRVADELADFDEITPSVVPLVFHADDEAEQLRPILHRNLLRTLVLGASNELEKLNNPEKAINDDLFELPEATRLRIRQALEELEGQAYWLAIQSETKKRLIDVIQSGIDDQASNYQIGIRIRELLGGFEANKRAQKIARTEVTGALNAGHEAAREELYASGLAIGKQWLTIGDSDVRLSHVELNNVAVGPAVDFDVGGYQAPYPGFYTLPAVERINCRCTTISVLS